MGPLYGSYSNYSEPPSGKMDQLNSDDPGSVQIPQTDFDPLYSEIANYDSEIDVNFLNIPEFGVTQPNENDLQAPFGNLQQGSQQFATSTKLSNLIGDLDSDPPIPEGFDADVYQPDEIPSSPPLAPYSSTTELSRAPGYGSQHQEIKKPQITAPRHQQTFQRYQTHHYYNSSHHSHQHRNSVLNSSQRSLGHQYSLSTLLDPSTVLSDQYIPSDRLNSEFELTEPPIPEQQPLYSMPDYGELPSSPPSSPRRDEQEQRPIMFTTNLDSLGITLPFENRPQSSISRVIHYPHQQERPTINTPSLPASSPGDLQPSLASPNLMPPIPKQLRSPFLTTDAFKMPSKIYGVNAARSTSNLQHPPLLSPSGFGPDLSPALSEASSVSPDPESDTFSWQPVVTVPYSEDTEAIIEQQRKPKQKRKSCLPDGAVDEYVGTTDQEGVHICLFPNCQRLFKRTYNLRSHIQTHLCDRPYICKTCGANFVRPHDLRRHERCHSNTKPFVCPCGKGFNRQDAMQRHRSREICEGAIHTGIPKSPKPRGRPKGRKSTPNHTPTIGYPNNTPVLKQSPRLSESTTPVLTHTPVMESPQSPEYVHSSLRDNLKT